MKNIIFIAPPAAGKGTQSDLLVKKFGYVHISTGDLLRSEVASGTKLGVELAELMKSGALASDEIVTELLKNRLLRDDVKNGLILDGYPRTVEQAEKLSKMADEINLNLDLAIYLDIDEETALQRACGRITCSECGRGYNKYEDSLKPKVEDVCDDCGSSLISRTDDNEETFKARFENYVKNTKPLLNYYKDLGILREIEKSETPEETFSKIERVI